MERLSDCQPASLQSHGNSSFERSSEKEVSLWPSEGTRSQSRLHNRLSEFIEVMRVLSANRRLRTLSSEKTKQRRRPCEAE
ncbi:hypothetical protein EMIT0P4_140028 [Pseudomonas sp. IT-P4]